MVRDYHALSLHLQVTPQKSAKKAAELEGEHLAAFHGCKGLLPPEAGCNSISGHLEQALLVPKKHIASRSTLVPFHRVNEL